MTRGSSSSSKRNGRLALVLTGLAVGMVGFSFALVPLYGLYCDVVGANKLGAAADARNRGVETNADVAVEERYVTVVFDANVNSELPWDFAPLQRSVRVKVGEPAVVSFKAHNRADKKIVGQAIPAVTPWQVTGYLSKLECFCFNRQELQPGEAVEMPLQFVVSPDLPEQYGSMVLSYTFMNAGKTTNEPLETISSVTDS